MFPTTLDNLLQLEHGFEYFKHEKKMVGGKQDNGTYSGIRIE